MASLDFLFQPNVSVSRSLATDRYFLKQFRKESRKHRPVLRVYATTGDVLSIGRYHRLPPGSNDLEVKRRLSGGRVYPFGDGFLGFSLLLPHRSALVSAEPYTLAPYQVPNRYARGVLRGLKKLGLDAYYPGRDFLTVDRRTVGMFSFETDEQGALVFEGVLAVERDFGILTEFLSIADPEGILQGEVLEDHALGTLNAGTYRQLAVEAIAESIRKGFEEQFRVKARRRQLNPLEEQAVDVIERKEGRSHWLESRKVRNDLDRSAATRTLLGLFEVDFTLEQEKFLREIQFSGDFIANSAGVAALERELRLCPADWRSVALVADRVFNRPDNYILGIGKLRTIPDTIVKALPA